MDDIQRRTMCRSAFDEESGEVFFYWSEPTCGVWSEKVRWNNHGGCKIPTGAAAEALVNRIRMSRVDMKTKLRWIAEKKRQNEYEKRTEQERLDGDMRKEMNKSVDRQFERMNMGSHYRPMATVP